MSEQLDPSLWPHLVATYAYTGTAAAAALSIDLALRTDAYFPPPPGAATTDTGPRTASDLPQWQQTIEDDLATYTRVCAELEQQDDEPGVPGPGGNAVDLLLTNTLFGPAPAPLPPAEAAKVRAYVADCVAYLQQRKDGETPASAPARHLDVPVAVTGAVGDDIVRLQVSLALARRPVPADPALAAQADGLTVTAEVAARTDTADGEKLGAFAAAFEAIFTTAEWDLRVGTGNGEPAPPRSAAACTVWAVRLAKNASGKGLGFELGADMSYYAAKPVANALRSGTADVLAYTTGSGLAPKGTPTSFDGADLNAWAQTALGAIDTFLAPSFSSPALVVDAMGTDTEGVVAKVLRHKETLAGAIGGTVAPILVTSKTDADSLAAAGEKLREHLLRELSAAYSVSAIAVCDVTGARYGGVLPAGVQPPRFYGLPARAAGGLNAGAPNLGTSYAFSSTRIPLTTKADGTTRLAFALSSKNAGAAEVTLPLRYVGSDLEYDITDVPGIEGCEQRSWIAFVTGPIVRDLAGGADLHIPIPLRTVPAPPVLTVQTALPWEQTADERGDLQAAGQAPGDLGRWNYGFGYVGSRFPQDTVRATLDVNVVPAPAPSPSPFAAPDDRMFAALAQFVSVYPQIAADFQTALRGIDADTDPASAQVGVARAAMTAFETIVDGFAAAYVAWAAQQRDARFAQASDSVPAVRFVFDLRLTTYTDPGTGQPTDQAQIDVIPVSLEPQETVLPKPWVELAIAGQTILAQEVAPPKDALVSYRYQRTDTAANGSAYVTYDEALLEPARTVSFRPLDVFGVQRAQSGVRIERNEFLVPGVATTEAFRLRTPLVQFAQPIVPLLRYLEYPLTQAGPGPLAKALAAFFGRLLASAGKQGVLIGFESSFSYELAAGIPRPSLPIVLLPPVTASATDLAFIVPLVTMIERWRAAVEPQEQAAGSYDFALSVFSAAAGFEQIPLLQIADLHIAASDAFPPA